MNDFNMYRKYQGALYLEMSIVNYLEFLEKEVNRLSKTVPSEYSLDYLFSLSNTKEYFEFVLKELYKKEDEKNEQSSRG